jgi:hypothetical protein
MTKKDGSAPKGTKKVETKPIVKKGYAKPKISHTEKIQSEPMRVDGRLNVIIPKWHEDDIKYEYYYCPKSRQLKATIGILKSGTKLFISYTIASPKEKEVSKEKAKKLIDLRITSFLKRYGKKEAKNPLTPIFVIPDYKQFFKQFSVTNFKDILNLLLDDVFAKIVLDASISDSEKDKQKNYIFHVKSVFYEYLPKFHLKQLYSGTAHFSTPRFIKVSRIIKKR